MGLKLDGPESTVETFLELAKKHYRYEPEAAWATWPTPPAVQSPHYLVRPESSTAETFWLQVELMEMSAGLNERYLVRLHDITADIMAQRLTWTFNEQVGHKLRTPLTTLSGFLKILREDLLSLSDTEKEILLAHVDISATRLQEELMGIFQYLEALTLPKHKRSGCSLAEIPGIVAKIKTGLELTSVALAYEDIDQPADISISASSQIIELSLWELLENAKKFHPQQSPELSIKISGSSTGVRIQISDNGLTLSPEQLAKMWIPYYQAEKYFTGQITGMGLGLAMVASMVWSAGGTCLAYNRPGGPGLVIELQLPYDKTSHNFSC